MPTLNVDHRNKISHNSAEIDVTHTLSGKSGLLQRANIKISWIKVSVLCVLTRHLVLKIDYSSPWVISISLIKAFLNVRGFYHLVFTAFQFILSHIDFRGHLVCKPQGFQHQNRDWIELTWIGSLKLLLRWDFWLFMSLILEWGDPKLGP